MEEIKDPDHCNNGRLHYLPHHPVIRQDKETTKICVVYGASARTNGPSLNDCLHTGGVSASPFLLNATIDHHMKKIETTDLDFVSKFRRSIYVDDVATGAATVDEAYQFYKRANSHLAKASFNLRKFESNSSELRQRINENEHLNNKLDSRGHLPTDPNQNPIRKQVFGISWNPVADTVIFNIGEVSRLMNESCPTKRNIVSLATRFYDPLGVIVPTTVQATYRLGQTTRRRSAD